MMIRNLLLAAAVIVAAPALADDAPAEVAGKTFCQEIAIFAESIMDGRQNGVKMTDMMDVVDDPNEPFGSLLLDIIQNAYGQPRWEFDDSRKNAVLDFTNKEYADCLRATGNPK